MKRLALLLPITALVAGLFHAHVSGTATMSDKLQFVATAPNKPLAQVNDKLKFVGQPETKAARDARMRWWREARFGMFIHWGLF